MSNTSRSWVRRCEGVSRSVGLAGCVAVVLSRAPAINRHRHRPHPTNPTGPVTVRWWTALVLLVAVVVFPTAVCAAWAASAVPGTVIGWGDNSKGQASPPRGLSGVTAAAAGGRHSLALKSDGTVVGWGDNSHGQATPPAGLAGVTAIAAGGDHSLALKADGTVIGWGDDKADQASPPRGLSGVTAIAAGGNHSLALRSGGTVVGWGANVDHQSSPPASLSGVVAIAAGESHSLALQSDGTVVGWGDDDSRQARPPKSLSGVVAIAAGGNHSLALKLDGTVVGWGDDSEGQASPPAGLSGVVAIAAGGSHSLALTSDGTVVGWGDDSKGQASPPAGLSGVTAIAAGRAHSVALGQLRAAPGRPSITEVRPGDGQATVSFAPGDDGLPPSTYTVTATPTAAGGTTVTTSAMSGSPILVTGLVNGTTYTFAVTASNSAGSVTSTSSDPVTIGVAPSVSGTPPTGLVGSDYLYGYSVTGMPAPTVTVSGGSLPPGLELTGSGVVTGTPTAAGTFEFTVTATSGVGSASLESTISVESASPPPGVPTITGVQGGDGSAVVTFTPGADGVPAGASYTVTATPVSVGGVVVTTEETSGSPITVRALVNGTTYVFTVTASSSAGSATSTTSAPTTIGAAASISGRAPSGAVGSPYSFGYTVGGAPAPLVTITAGRLPAGLALSAAGTLSGSPIKAGTYDFTVSASNAVGSASVHSKVVVGPRTRPQITAVAPASGPARGGTKVVITGIGLTGASKVSFGAAGDATILKVTDTKIVATSPPYSGTVNSTGERVKVRVTAPVGIITGRAGTDEFRYLPS